MAKYQLADHRNIGIMAHVDAGKTTTTERILFYTGRVYKMGEVHDGSATMDWMEQEQERGITITAAATSCVWDVEGVEYHYNIIDTPGHVDFTVEVERSIRVLDGAVIVLCAVAGVQPQTEVIWGQSERYLVPKVVFINKMDRVGADFFVAFASLKNKLNATAVALQLPIGNQDKFIGVIDLVKMQAVYYGDGSLADGYQLLDLTVEQQIQAGPFRDLLIDSLSKFDDAILEKALEGELISEKILLASIRAATISRKIVPVLCGSAFRNKGVHQLLDTIAKYLPSPEDTPSVEGISPVSGEKIYRMISPEENLCAITFKVVADSFAGQLNFIRVYSGVIRPGDVVYNSSRDKSERVGQLLKIHANKREEVSELAAGDIGAVIGLNKSMTGDTICSKLEPIVLEQYSFPSPVISIAIEAKTRQDQDKMYSALKILAIEDPSFSFKVDPDTGQTLMFGMGELHLEILVERLSREFKVGCSVGAPRVAYKESILHSAVVEVELDRIWAGKPQFAFCGIAVRPVSPGSGILFVCGISESSLPTPLSQSFEKGLRESAAGGVIAGYPLVDFEVLLAKVRTRDGESNEMAFHVLGSLALKQAVLKATPILLEPIMKVEVFVPSQYLGDIIADVHSRRGQVRSMEEQSNSRVVYADVPLAEMFGYSTKLRSSTQGRAVYTMQLASYQPVGNSSEITGVSQHIN